MKKPLYVFIVLLCPFFVFSQNLEVEGNAKITVMNQSNTAENLVVLLPDSTLGVREASSLLASTGNYGTVVNPVTGKVWLDRNLGATQVATNTNDALSYGDLYQWGRAADGHQIRTSSTTTTQATDWLADVSDTSFIITHTNWLNANVTDLWSGTAAENNPCPSGFRIPTNAEWNQERRTWSTNDGTGAFASPLKLPTGGFRDHGSGIIFAFSVGSYWSSTVSGNASQSREIRFGTGSSPATMTNYSRAEGYSVRCIKD